MRRNTRWGVSGRGVWSQDRWRDRRGPAVVGNSEAGEAEVEVGAAVVDGAGAGRFRIQGRIGEMKVVVSSSGKTLDDSVDLRFGRAKQFLVVDTDTGEVRVVDNNQNVEAMQGAGIQAAQTVASESPEYVITGHCGPKAFSVLRAAGVGVITGFEGSVREAVEALKQGRLKASDAADVQGHWT